MKSAEHAHRKWLQSEVDTSPKTKEVRIGGVSAVEKTWKEWKDSMNLRWKTYQFPDWALKINPETGVCEECESHWLTDYVFDSSRYITDDRGVTHIGVRSPDECEVIITRFQTWTAVCLYHFIKKQVPEQKKNRVYRWGDEFSRHVDDIP